MKKILCFFALGGVVAGAQAQPMNYTNLGTIVSTSSDYNVADLDLVIDLSGSAILWYRFDFLDTTSDSGTYLDIDMFRTSATSPDTEIGVYRNDGTMLANDDDDGHALMSALSFGNTSPRTHPTDPFGATNGLAHNGRDGNLTPGTYWLAVGLYNTTFGATDWNVTSTSTGAGQVRLNFRTDAVPEPASMAALGLGLAGILARRRRK